MIFRTPLVDIHRKQNTSVNISPQLTLGVQLVDMQVRITPGPRFR